MELVTPEEIDKFIQQYEQARGGSANEQTDSEAMFVLVGKYSGIYMLTTGIGPMWIGLQNATARWTNKGKSFDSVQHAIDSIFSNRDISPTNRLVQLYYSEDSVERLRWIADRIEAFKASGDFLLY